MKSIRFYSPTFLSPNSKPKLPKKSSPIIENDSFHSSIGLMLVIGQCFAQVPIIGVLDPNHRRVRFKLCNFRTMYSIVFIVAGTIEACLVIRRSFTLNFSSDSIEHLIFIIICLIGSSLLCTLARKWPSLIRFWQAHENNFLHPPYTTTGIRLKTKIKIVSVTFLIMAFVEHLLSNISGTEHDYHQFKICKIKNVDFIEYMFVKQRSHIFLVIPFHYVLAAISVLLGLIMAFSWNYVHLMIMVLSIGIAFRFNQINHRIKSSVKGFENIDNRFWNEIRKDYVHVVDILQKVDTKISLLILVSCASNLYYICLQLFNSFTQISFFFGSVYFWYSLVFLIGRTLCVLSFAASVHDASRKSIGLLRDLPSKTWTNEAQRFIDMMTSECHALTGNKFFYLTRNMILGMIGTVVTLELLLLDEVEQEADRQSICNLKRFNFSSHS